MPADERPPERPVTLDDINEMRLALANAVASLKEITDAKFVTFRALLDGNAEKVALALAAADKAVTKAETATEKRFEGVNEFRQQLADQTSTFLPRSEAAQRMDTIEKDIDQLRADLGVMREGSANLAGRLTIIGAVVTILISLVTVGANLAFR